MSFVERNAWIDILLLVVEDRMTLAKWFMDQITQKQLELGKDAVNLAAAALIVAREMGFDVQSWKVEK